MALIEGVGDEVIQFVVIVLIVLVAALAWWSTNARPDRYRTVLVMRSRNFHPVTVSIRSGSNSVSSSNQNSMSTNLATPETSGPNTSSPTTEEVSREGARVIRLQEMDSIVDADVAMMNHNRLHFYRRMDSTGNIASTAEESTSEESETNDESDPPSNVQMREMDSIVNAMEADVNTDPFETPAESNVITTPVPNGDKPPEASSVQQPEEENNDINPEAQSNSGETRILIKLKYLNDTLKEVEGSLDELLKDFKWRHFTPELRSQCRVRLIYNGRVLHEASTLRACGLRDRAVVHCLVHPPRNNAQRAVIEEPALEGTAEIIAEGAAPERNWDLENILMTLVSVALTVVWFFRCEYSNMFTASASVALFGLTVFYSVAIFGLYLSDTFHFDRRPAPAHN